MATIVGSPSTSTSSPAPTPAPSQPQTQTYFDIVTSNLLKLGALTLEDFHRDPYQEPAPQENFLSNPLYHDAPVAPPLVLDDNQDGGENGKPAPTHAPIFVLHQICSQTFGSIDALDYEIIEEEGKESESLPSPILSKPAHRFFPLFCLHFLCRETVYPHYHASKWRDALVHLKTRVFAQSRGARCRCGRGSRHGRDRLYQARFPRGRRETWTRARAPRRARLGRDIDERRGGGSWGKGDREVLHRVACWACQAAVDIPH